MTISKQVSSLMILVALTLGGCESGDPGRPTSMDDLANQASAQKVAAEQQAAEEARKAEEAQSAAAAAAQAAAEPEKTAVGSRPPMEGGYLSAIGGARRHVLNVVDSLSWIQGVRNFKAEQGRKPKDHEEFMNGVVAVYDLQLPAIEPDQEYLYDPEGETDGDFGQLYVVQKGEVAETPTPPNPN